LPFLQGASKKAFRSITYRSVTSAPAPRRDRRIARMRLLILGGTSFVGRAIVTDALDRGHHVTLFNRGRRAPDLFPQAERRIGDRQVGDYASLATGTWDAVIDVSAYVPRHRRAGDRRGGRAMRAVPVHLDRIRLRPQADVAGCRRGGAAAAAGARHRGGHRPFLRSAEGGM